MQQLSLKRFLYFCLAKSDLHTNVLSWWIGGLGGGVTPRQLASRVGPEGRRECNPASAARGHGPTHGTERVHRWNGEMRRKAIVDEFIQP